MKPKPRQDGIFLSWFLFGGVGLLALLTGLDDLAPWLPFFLAIFVVGLAHGAADWILLSPSSVASASKTFLLYAAVGLIVAGLATLFPRAAIFGFFGLTAIHFGIADERDLRRFEPVPFRKPTPFRFSGVFRMGTFLALVCTLRPEEVSSLFAKVEMLLGSSNPGANLSGAIGNFSPYALAPLASLWLLSLAGTIRTHFREGRNRSRRLAVELGEGSLLLGIAALLDPVFVIGAYFLFWHALRHCFLIIGKWEDEGPPRSRGRQFLRLHLLSWPLYLPVIPVMVWLVAWRGSLFSPADWVAALLVICIIFTLPHHAIVERQLIGNLRRRRPETEKNDVTVPVGGNHGIVEKI